MPRPRDLDLRLIVITDARLAAPADVMEVVRAALEAGAPAIQLRDKSATSKELLEQAIALRELTMRHDALLFVNDRLDIAMAAEADGIHIGPADLPLDVVRRTAPESMLIGVSTDDPASAREAETGGADYIGCGAVFGTTTKKEVGSERIGPEGLERVARAVDIPVVGIGGITLENVGRLAGSGAAGIAVIGALMTAPDPAAITRELLEALTLPSNP